MDSYGNTVMKEIIEDKLNSHFGITAKEATNEEVFCACAILLRGIASRNKAKRNKVPERELHYLSMEFLMGRSLMKMAFNLGVVDELTTALRELGFEPTDIFEAEPDAGLGNGGLGRLAACYMDSMASLGLPATGYSLCYELGMFRQEIRNGKQIERADPWQISANNWLVPNYDDAVEVKFGGVVEENWDYDGKCTTSVRNATSILAVPRDMLITGFNSETTNTLRLWEAHSPSSIDMNFFTGGEYIKSMEQRTMAEVITKVLYPADEHTEGKILRIRQQYFCVSATAQSIVKRHRARYGSVMDFDKHHVFQINDTHPTFVIPELMRIFMDEDGLGWQESWEIVSRCVAYTNHTVMSEALETWPQELVSMQLPRIWQIIRELDSRHRKYLLEAFKNDEAAISRNLIIEGGKVHMANICLAVCFKVNGVSELHSNILRTDLFRDMASKHPDKFCNVTNGIDHRRWLTQINPKLHELIVELCCNDDYLKQPDKLSEFERFASDSAVLRRLEEIKHDNKLALAAYVKKTSGFDLDTNAVFDVQVKRMHEYKRQLLCAMLIAHLQNRLHADPNCDFLPRTFIFGAKAASSYKVAKRIISLICSLADDVNNDPFCKGKLQVVFLENYRVSVAGKLMPAAQISEQISTAGKEASGTGNMKLMMNGAITIGTLDGANVEMYERLGDENMFLFGLHADEVREKKRGGYNPLEIFNRNADIRNVLNRFSAGLRDRESYSDLVSSLVYGGDGFMLLADFDSYVAAHDRLYGVMADTEKRSAISLRNIARSGIFAADRSITEYNENIWHLK